MPLVGFEGVAQLLGPPARPLTHLHSFLLLEAQEGSEEGFVFFDFLPADPTSPIVAAKLVSGGEVVGATRERRLPRLMPGARLVGEAQAPNALEAARQFNRWACWSTRGRGSSTLA